MTARDPSKTQGELALVKGCVSRDTTAWRDMISKYGALVAHAARTTLQRVIKNVDPNSVEEASQAIWAMLIEDDCRRLRSFAGQSALSTWLTVLSTRRTLDYIRTEMRKGSLKHVKIEAGDDEERDLVEALKEREAPEAAGDDELQLLHESMDRLPTEDRLILKMYYLDGLSYRSIAKAMNVAPNTVSSYIFRAREKLKAILAKKE